MPGRERRSAPGLVGRLLLVALRGYKILLSPMFAGSCRFTPSCADYTAEAIRVHGALAGLRLGAARVGRCHPWGPWGFDPVPSGRRSVSVPDVPIAPARARLAVDAPDQGALPRITNLEDGSRAKARRSPCAVERSGAKVQ